MISPKKKIKEDEEVSLEHLGVLGIAIHEMCHIIYSQQTALKQHSMDSLFNQHDSEFAQKAYAYLDEGLATALGNGWAYREVHGEIDTNQWYNHEYIDGYAHAIFDEVTSYVENGKSIDDAFLNKSVDIFEKTFPNAMRDVMGLLNQVMLVANVVDEQKLRNTIDLFIEQFNSRGIWMATPANDPEGLELLEQKSTSKFFILESEKEMGYEIIERQFPNFVKPNAQGGSFLYTYKDKKSGSMIFLADLEKIDHLENLLIQVSEMEFIDQGMLLKYKGL